MCDEAIDRRRYDARIFRDEYGWRWEVFLDNHKIGTRSADTRWGAKRGARKFAEGHRRKSLWISV